MDEDGKQLVSSSDMVNTVELGGGSELIINKRTDKGTSTKTFGSREYLRYYRQKPRPTPTNMAITAALASRFVLNLLFNGLGISLLIYNIVELISNLLILFSGTRAWGWQPCKLERIW